VALGGGHTVIADAVSGHAEQRDALEAAAKRAGARFLGIWLEAPLAVREARVGRRVADVSDAGVDVARRQHEPEAVSLGWWRLDASGDLALTRKRLAEALEAARLPLRAN
jgi:hypothetical protein